ncbi:phosphoglycerate kinase [Saccharospirillum salsuginis]|uniref:Phosphoglycerate kinase n=1 Tax=Saccharospirillum salsuginis TaxID=418750 RepID=A0A918N813_9GAMM|nr:phosphoglycerate kinase [Saccharospirillum salsuginis]GGX49424.1 phosphoglycerate kinase [Saccharospirillum salsuginis]
MSVIKMSDLDLAGKRVLIRQDLNVPLDDQGNVTSDQRITASLPTIREALEQGAKVMIMSHLGRPTEGEYEEKYSLAPVAAHMGKLLGREIPLVKDWVDGVDTDADVVILENVRFNVGEKKNDDDLAQKMAKLCDVYVMDAFGTAHRAQASTHGVAKHAPVACAGPLLAGELEALAKALDNPARPMVAVVGGAKVSTKLTVLESLSQVCDQLIVGGGISNTFVAARGYNVGNSLHEKDLIPQAKALMDKLDIPEPIDVRTGKEFSPKAEATVKPVDQVQDDEEIMDLGPETAAKFAEVLKGAKTILWNGPCGVFEFDNFAGGTRAIAEAIADSGAFSVLGGGDVIAAVQKFGMEDKFSYISTGGGAFLEFVEGKKLPAVEILEQRAQG